MRVSRLECKSLLFNLYEKFKETIDLNVTEYLNSPFAKYYNGISCSSEDSQTSMSF